MNKFFVFLFIISNLFSSLAYANFCEVFLKVSSPNIKSTSAYKTAHENFVFPPEAQFFTFEYLLRVALHEAFEGLDFYTEEPLDFQNMSIDHILPRALGGLDNVFNYAPTNPITNSLKGHKFVYDDLKILEAVRDIYGPRVMALLKHYGAFENREVELERAIQTNHRRRHYSSSKKRSEIRIADIPIKDSESHRVTVFRRTMDPPTFAMSQLILNFSNIISGFDEAQLQDLLTNKNFKFKMNVTEATKLKFDEQLQYDIALSFRSVGKKIAEDALAVEIKLFEVLDYDINPHTNEAEVSIEFHPMFLLKLLEMPRGNDLAEKYIDLIFRPTDIKVEEFIEWTNDL